MTKKGGLDAQDYWLAWQIYKGECFVHLNQNEKIRMGSNENLENYGYLEHKNPELESPIPDPEKILLKKDAVQNLSEEAQEVIDMILNAPAEVIKALSCPNGLITKRSVRLGLQKIWRSKFIAKKVVEELSQWTNRL